MTDVLDLSPEGGINDGTFWKDETHFKQACNYLYNYLPNWEAILYADNASDYAFGSSPDAISSGTNGILSEDGVWNNSYWYIRAANNIIQKAESSSIADAIKNRYVGEAKFLRALAYFNMVKRFGKVIYIDKCLDVNSPELFAARDEREFVIDKVLEDLDFAQKYLPKASELPEADYGRFTQGAALALKARVALYEGTHQKYHGEGDGKKYLEIAKKTSYSLMTEYKDKYDLYEGTYENLFRFIAEKNCESILSIMYGESIETEDIRLTNCPRYLEAGATRGTRKLINSFLCTDGLPITKSILWKPKEHVKPGDEFINRDPRLRQSFWTISDTYKGGEPYYISYTAYMLKKYCDPEQLGLYEGKDDIMFIRYAEVLLVYAESTYELEGAISDDDLDLSINLLRKRVDMPSLTNKFVQDNGLNMLEEIRRERGLN